jgi:hypothetical protein
MGQRVLHLDLWSMLRKTFRYWLIVFYSHHQELKYDK